MEYQARFNDGVTAKTRTVRVRLSPDGLEIADPEGAPFAYWPADTLRFVDGGNRRGPVRVASGADGLARLAFDDRTARREILARYPAMARGNRLSGRTIGIIALWSALGLAGLGFVVWIVIPAAAVQIAAMIPQHVQSRVGERVADQVIRLLAVVEHKRADRMVCETAAGRAALDALMAPLAAVAPPDIDFRVRVVDSSLVNAVAMPGGHILATSGLLEFVGGPNELAGVLAHEMGHVALNHSAENMIKVGGISGLFSLLVGDVSGGAVIIAVGNSLIQGRFSQEAESEADAFAVRLLARAGLDARPFLTFFERIASLEDEERPEGRAVGMEWISTHPPTRARADAIRRMVSGGAPALSSDRWEALKRICPAG